MANDTASPTVTVTQLSKLFNLTEVRVQQLATMGVVVRTAHGRYDLWQSIKGYIVYLQDRAGIKNATTDAIDDEAGDYQKYRARLYKAKSEQAEIEVSLLKGKVHESFAVEEVWNKMINNARSRLLALPMKVSPQLEGSKDVKEIKSVLENAIYEALTELSNYDSSRVIEEFIQQHQPEVETATEIDGESMG